MSPPSLAPLFRASIRGLPTPRRRRAILILTLAALGIAFSWQSRAQTQIHNGERSIRDWSIDDFQKHGHIETGPTGGQRDQLRFWRWPDNTLLDLRESTFLALGDGPFKTCSLPDTYPTGAALATWQEASSAGKYPVSIKGRESHNILIWLGKGDYPAPLPDGVTLTRDLDVWTQARDAWLKRHPDVASPNEFPQTPQP